MCWRSNSSAAGIPALCGDELERVHKELDDKEKAINVRHAHKIEEVCVCVCFHDMSPLLKII